VQGTRCAAGGAGGGLKLFIRCFPWTGSGTYRLKNYSTECLNRNKTIKIIGMTVSLNIFHAARFSAIFNRANYLSPQILKPSFVRAACRYIPQVLRYISR
jgi:hypothetical protein